MSLWLSLVALFQAPLISALPVSAPFALSDIAFLSGKLRAPEPTLGKNQWRLPFFQISKGQQQAVRPLPGALDKIPVFHSNCPEVISNEGILLSTFSSIGKGNPYAHLNFAFSGRFDIFAHHIAKRPKTQNQRTLYLGIILHNPGERSVTVDILSGASYLTAPDAPFVTLPSQVEDPSGKVYAGPGSRVAVDILRGRRKPIFPASLEIPAKQSRILLNQQISPRSGTSLNGSSTYLRLQSRGKVQVASLALFGRRGGSGKERAPTLSEWEQLVQKGALITPRERIPTFSFDRPEGRRFYSRVAGVAEGSQWQAQVTDSAQARILTIPQTGGAFSYVLNTLKGVTFGTKQIQSATLLVRYPDTAIQSQGNYGVQYSLSLPLYNPTATERTVALALQTPLKDNNNQRETLKFLNPPAQQVFFRGPVKVSYPNDQGKEQARYFHLVQRRGEQGKPLVKLKLQPREKKQSN